MAADSGCTRTCVRQFRRCRRVSRPIRHNYPSIVVQHGLPLPCTSTRAGWHDGRFRCAWCLPPAWQLPLAAAQRPPFGLLPLPAAVPGARVAPAASALAPVCVLRPRLAARLQQTLHGPCSALTLLSSAPPVRVGCRRERAAGVAPERSWDQETLPTTPKKTECVHDWTHMSRSMSCRTATRPPCTPSLSHLCPFCLRLEPVILLQIDSAMALA
jgi:hypothetical protein